MWGQLLLLGSAALGVPQAADTTFAIGRDARLEIESRAGNIDVRGWDRSEVEVRTNGRAAHVEHASLLVGEDEPTPHETEAPTPDGPEPQTVPRAPDAGWTPTLP